MVTPTNDQDRLIDQTLSLLRNAMAETKTVLSVEQLGRAEKPKDVLPETPGQQEKTALLIDQSLSLLRNAIAETNTVLPAAEIRGAEKPKDAVPETPFQQEQTASLIEQTLSLVENVAALEPEEPETPSNMQQLVIKQASKDVLPTEPPVQEQQAPSLIDQTLSMVEQSLQHLVAKQTSKEPPTVPVQEERAASLINQTLSMVAVAVSESTVTQAPPPSLQQPVAKQTSKVMPTESLIQEERTASLIAQALSTVKSVAAEVAPSSFQQPVIKQASKEVAPTDSLVQGEPATSVIGQAQSLVGDASIAELNEFETPSNMQRQPIAEQTSNEVLLAAEPSVQQEQTASFAEHAVSLVDNVVVPEPIVNDAPSPSVRTPKALPPREPPSQDASLVDQTLSFAKNVVVHETNSIEVTSQKQLSPKERLDLERAEIQKRVATFKANQQRFQQEREEYYAVTMAKVRATRSTPPNP
jgi:hypothetical protein